LAAFVTPSQTIARSRDRGNAIGDYLCDTFGVTKTNLVELAFMLEKDTVR